MTILTGFAIVVLGGTAALIIWSFMIGRATKLPERELESEAGGEADEPDGPDKRAGGPEFRAAALRAAQEAPQPAARRRLRPVRRRRSLTPDRDAPADLPRDPEL